MGPDQLLASKIHRNFSSSDQITKFLAIPLISIFAPVELFPSPSIRENGSPLEGCLPMTIHSINSP